MTAIEHELNVDSILDQEFDRFLLQKKQDDDNQSSHFADNNLNNTLNHFSNQNHLHAAVEAVKT